ncbi:ionotropic receptor 93a-like [Oratosquilla oratoria]|uniref:ionotropic receptor 93a-like n=1 Tax=Oratosquilla oratoria TaxID=337810 RepID=UPI003F774BC2
MAGTREPSLDAPSKKDTRTRNPGDRPAEERRAVLRPSEESHRALLLGLLVLCVSGAAGQLDNENAVIGVFLESGMVQGRRLVSEDLIKSVVSETKASMTQGSLDATFLPMLDPESLPEEMSAVMTLASCDATHLAAPAVAQMGKLHLAVTGAGCPRLPYGTAVTLPLAGGSSDVYQLFTDLRNRNTLTWTDIVIIHDQSVEKSLVGDIVNTLAVPSRTRSETSITLIDLAAIETSSMRLGTLFMELGTRPGEPKTRQYLVMVYKDEVVPIQDLARSMGLFGSKNQWLFVTPDTHALKYDMGSYLVNMKDGDNMAFVYNMSDMNPTVDCMNGFDCTIDLVLRLYGSELSAALEEELQLYYQISEEEWAEVKPSTAERSTTVADKIKMKLVESESCFKCTRWGLQAGEVKSQDRFELLNVATWQPLTGLELKDDLFPHVTGGFRRRVIPVTSVHYPPWQIFMKDKIGRVVAYKGLMFEVLDELASRLNFTYVVMTPPDGKWGTKDSSGNWNGMIKMVQDKQVLLGIAAFTVSDDRLKVVNFTSTIDRQPYTFMIARPKELSRVVLFMEPFANDTWICIAVMVFIMGPILFLINRSSPYYTYYELYDGKGLFKLQNCSWYVFGAILQQGGTQLPLSNSGRMVVGFWWIFVLVVVTTYSGNLVAFLTFPQIENPVNNLEDLVKSKDSMTWGYLGGTVLEEYFKTAEEPKFAKVGEDAENHEALDDSLFYRIREEDHAYLEWKTNLLFLMKEQFLRTDRCDYSLGKEEFYHEFVAPTVPKDSPYVDLFNAEIKKMQTGGLIQKWKQDYWPKKDKCSSTAYGGGDASRTVSLSDMQGSFFLLFIGFCLAAFIISCECLFSKREKSEPGTPSSTGTMVKPFMA